MIDTPELENEIITNKMDIKNMIKTIDCGIRNENKEKCWKFKRKVDEQFLLKWISNHKSEEEYSIQDGEAYKDWNSIAEDIGLLAEENKLLDVIYETHIVSTPKLKIEFSMKRIRLRSVML
jgi:hypothetical protein